MLCSRAGGLALGLALDAALADPRRHHPVAVFGSLAQRVEQRTWADSHTAGAVHVLATAGPVTVLAILVERLSRRHPTVHLLATALTTWAVVGSTSLAREGRIMADHLGRGDIDQARGRLGNLCGRDPSSLDEHELARAAVESMAENTADAAVASLFWGALTGIPGMVAHRALNTLDAMVGHRNDRYGRFGTAAARLDDAADLLPARATGAMACLLAPTVGGSTREAWSVMRSDAHRHPSPNGGWCESAWAGALGVQLGGRNVYFGRSEDRPLLGRGARPDVVSLRRASRLVGRVTLACGALAVTGLCLTARGRRGRA